MEQVNLLREHLVKLLTARSAHANFDAVMADFPEHLRGKKPAGAPHTPWQILEHMRIAQGDILEFSRNSDYVSPKWPEGYWPETEAPPDPSLWDASVNSFRDDLWAMQELVADPGTDLFAVIPHGTGQTLLREALVLADHNSHHLGQMVLLRKLMGVWPSD